MWADDPPANPTKALQVVVSRARNATCPEAIERTARGYGSHREDLAGRLGIDPAQPPQSLPAELLARDRPVRAGVHFDADRLIGRDADVAALQVLIKGHRLISIVGAGGLGKTRLAVSSPARRSSRSSTSSSSPASPRRKVRKVWLDNRLALLLGGSRDAPERHQTRSSMQATTPKPGGE